MATHSHGKRDKKKDKRKRSWWFIVYPESAPGNWREILDGYHIPWVESPLHDKDINPDGEVKKPHYHVLVLFESLKSFEQIKELTDSINSPIPQDVKSTKGAVRYMAHLDNPEKHQYGISGIACHGGADISAYLRISAAERYETIREMMDYCHENNITEIADLIRHAMENRFDDWFPLLCDSAAYIMGTYIKSLRHKQLKA